MNAEDIQATKEGLITSILKWLILFFFTIIILGSAFFYLLSVLGEPLFDRVFLVPPQVLPFAGVSFSSGLSLLIVLTLRFTVGPIEFEGLGFKFRGASGPVVLWVLCFLAIVAGLMLLTGKQ